MSSDILSYQSIRDQAIELGWDDVGITAAKIPEEDIRAYREWLEAGSHAELAYMENTIRCEPEKLLEGAKSAIIFISYYKQEPQEFRSDAGLIASYARGRDYHNVHKRRLRKFIRWLEAKAGREGIARGFSDSTPILEKALAVQAGLGWFGKNTLLIHRKYGTFTLISGVLTTLELPASTLSLRQPRCGSCTRCLDACPTGALTPYKLDANLCLSYHLIEAKKPIPESIRRQNPGYIFGCDICQDVCPHNVRKKPHANPDFAPNAGIGSYLTPNSIKEFQETPEKLFGSPLNRRGAEGLSYTARTQGFM